MPVLGAVCGASVQGGAEGGAGGAGGAVAEEEAARADVVECRRRGKGQECGEGGEKGWVPEREADRCARDGGEARENRRSVSLTNLRVTEKRCHDFMYGRGKSFEDH